MREYRGQQRNQKKKLKSIILKHRGKKTADIRRHKLIGEHKK